MMQGVDESLIALDNAIPPSQETRNPKWKHTRSIANELAWRIEEVRNLVLSEPPTRRPPQEKAWRPKRTERRKHNKR